MGDLKGWMEQHGILLCNTSPELPALEDIGCTWQDAMALVDAHQIFYSKAYKKRTAYLSREAYFLLKALRPRKPLEGTAQALYRLLEENPGADAKFLKSACGLEAKAYRAGFDFLLQNLYATALESGRTLNENWSELRYCAAPQWERLTGQPPPAGDPRERLWRLVGGIMSERQFQTLVR